MTALADAIGDHAARSRSASCSRSPSSAALWFLSRTERRDRRRVLGTLAGYAVASVGLGACLRRVCRRSCGA